MQKIIMIMIMMVLVGCMESENFVDETTDSELYNVEITAKEATVYSEPDESSNEFGKVYQSSVYEVLEVDDSEVWYKFRFNNVNVWIKKENCKLTKSKYKDFVPHTILDNLVNDYYIINDDIVVGDFNVTGYKTSFYVNDELIVNDYHLPNTGKYRYELVAEDSLGRVLIDSGSFDVVNNDDQMALYDGTEKHSEIVRWLDWSFIDNSKMQKLIVKQNDNEVFFWYEILLNGKVYYIPVDEKIMNYYVYPNEVCIEVVSNEKIINVTDITYISFDLMQNGYLLIYTAKESYIINYLTGDKFDVDRISISPDKNYLVSYSGNMYNTMIKTHNKPGIMVYQYINEEYIKIYENYEFNYGYDEVRWESNNVLIYSGVYYTDPWVCLNPVPNTRQIRLNLDEELIDPDIKKVSDEINIYNDMNTLSNVIEKRDLEEYEWLEFNRHFDLINNEMAIWFNVYSNDNLIGYTYRLLNDFDSNKIIMWDPIYLLLANDDKLEIDVEPILSQNFYIDWSLDSEGVLLIKHSFDSSYFRVYSLKDGSVLLENSGKILISRNKDLYLIYDENNLSIGHFDKSNNLVNDYNISLEKYHFVNCFWKSDTEVLFDLYDSVSEELIEGEGIISFDGFWFVDKLSVEAKIK